MSRWPGKTVIGLTGNIGVGKSVVRQMLGHLGAYTIDADALAHQAMLPGAPAYDPIVRLFGQFIVGDDGRISRPRLGSIVFSSPEALQQLEAISHPIVRQAIDVLVRRSRQRVVVIEAIKLLEGDLASAVDSVWVVSASRETQIQRLMDKRQMQRAEAIRRIDSQNPQADKIARADVVIENDGSIEATWRAIQSHWEEIRRQLIGASKTTSITVPDTDEPFTSRVDGVRVRRGMPGNAQLIADFISTQTGNEVTRMDVMMSFGQKSYLVAQNSDDAVVGLLGWTVENLITCMDEFHVADDVPVEHITRAIVQAVEEASKALRSEVGFVFLPLDTPRSTLVSFQHNGYMPVTLAEITVPAWREAVEESINGRSLHILSRQLSTERVLQPI